jgi:16S rRNA processing protein RimM
VIDSFTEPGIKYLKPQNKRAPRKVLLLKGRGPTTENEYILQLEESQTRDEATRLRGGTLFVRKEDRDIQVQAAVVNDDDDSSKKEEQVVVVEDDTQQKQQTQQQTQQQQEYFISDLVGLQVFLSTTTSQQHDEENNNKTHHPLFVGTVAGVVLAEDMCSIPGLGHDMLEINLPRGRGGTMSLRDELVLVPFVPQIVPLVSLAEGAVFIDPPKGLLDLTYVREEKVRIKGFLPPSSSS